ncbi:MAG: class I SAM-dependent methyltransferase [Nocardioidaceae bacterium]
MTEVPGARQFRAGGDDYDRFMGRYSRALAPPMADFADVRAGVTVLDLGCGPGAFTAEAVRRAGADAVRAVDPAPSFVEACRGRFPGVDVRQGRAEEVPLEDASVDRGVAQLVMHFVSEPDRAAAELRRVVRPGGRVAACVWGFDGGMEMLRAFWDVALEVDPQAPDEARTLRFGEPGELAQLWADAGLVDVAEQAIEVTSLYADVEELWQSFLLGVGPAGGWLVQQSPERQQRLHDLLVERLGRPEGAFELGAVALAARGTVPEG